MNEISGLDREDRILARLYDIRREMDRIGGEFRGLFILNAVAWVVCIFAIIAIAFK